MHRLLLWDKKRSTAPLGIWPRSQSCCGDHPRRTMTTTRWRAKMPAQFCRGPCRTASSWNASDRNSVSTRCACSHSADGGGPPSFSRPPRLGSTGNDQTISRRNGNLRASTSTPRNFFTSVPKGNDSQLRRRKWRGVERSVAHGFVTQFFFSK